FERMLAKSGESIPRADSGLPRRCEPLLTSADSDSQSSRAWGASGRWFKSSRRCLDWWCYSGLLSGIRSPGTEYCTIAIRRRAPDAFRAPACQRCELKTSTSPELDLTAMVPGWLRRRAARNLTLSVAPRDHAG